MHVMELLVVVVVVAGMAMELFHATTLFFSQI
jgi:hypothetical protein